MLRSISRFLQNRLKLVVNTIKSRVVKTSESKFLGFTFRRGLNKIDNVWDQLFPAEQFRIIKLMFEKIIVKPDNIDIQLWGNCIEQLALEIADSAKQEVA